MARNPGDAPQVQDVLIQHTDHKKFYPQMYQNASLALMNLISKVSLFNKRFDPELLEPFTELAPQGRAQTADPTIDEVWRTGYEMLVPITTNWPPGAAPSGRVAQRSGQPDLVISKIATQQRDLINFFTFGLTSAQVAALRPRLRVYKLHYVLDPPTTAKPRWTIKEPRKLMPAPLGEIEIHFDEAVSPDEYDRILGNPHSGYLAASGIKSFSWKLQGVNPGEVDNNIEASLKVYFSNVAELFRTQNILATSAAGRPIREGTFLDLVTYSTPPAPGNVAAGAADVCAEDGYEGEMFEIRVDVGYQIPPENSTLFNDAERSYIEESHRSLFLQLTDHVFEFNEDGSATMQANYRARYALTDPQYDLLRFESDKEIAAHQENLDELRAEAAETEEDSVDFNESQIASTEKELANLLEEKYRFILEELLIKHVYQAHIPESLLLLSSNPQGQDLNFGGSATRRQLQGGGAPGAVNMGQYDSAPGEMGSSIANPRDLYRFMFASPTGQYNRTFFDNVIKPLQDSYKNAVQNLKVVGPTSYVGQRHALLGINSTTSRVEEMVRDALEEGGTPHRRASEGYQNYGHVDGNGTVTTATPSDRTKVGPLVQFFYLGDILEVFLLTKGLTTAVREKRLGFIATDFEFLNPFKMLGGYQDHDAGRWEDSQALVSRPAPGSDSHGWRSFSPTLHNIKCGLKSLPPDKREHYTSTANLCHIPIEVGLFMDFLKRKIIDEQRITYFAEDFIRDILNEYVKPIYNQAVTIQSRNSPIPSVVTAETDNNIQFFRQTAAANAAYGYNVGYDEGPTIRRDPFFEHEVDADFRDTDFQFQPGSDEHDSGPRIQDTRTPLPGSALGLTVPFVTRANTIGGDISMFVPVVTNPTAIGARGPSGFPGGGQQRNTVLRRPKKAEDAATIKIISFQKNFVPYDGHYLNNMQKGIANFIVGLDRGMVKKVTFDRVDQAYLRESRASKSRGAGIDQLRELYHCNLTLVGNNLLLPGQLIYVEPNMTIFGRPTEENSIARKLGMGGYHLIIDVSSEIEHNWETTVKALHVAMPSVQPSSVPAHSGPTATSGPQHNLPPQFTGEP
jgi:hypothetical protein